MTTVTSPHLVTPARVAPLSPLLVLLVFQNLLNPFSPFLTLATNLAAAAYLLLRNKLHAAGFDPYVFSAVFATLLWLLLVVCVRGDPESQILLKYLRITVAITLLAMIAACAGDCVRSIITGLNFTLGFHIVLVMAQIALPDLTLITAPIFGFEREPTILEEYTLRKLGASSSYDTASLFSLAALFLYYLQFKDGRGAKFAWWAALAFAAAMFSSRTGMLLAMATVVLIMLAVIVRASLAAKLAALSLLAIVGAVAYVLLMPLLLHSLGISELPSDEVNLIFAAADYGTTGTLEALTADHLQPLNQPLSDLFLGYALDPNSIHRYTDLGYVKLVYHVGLPGTIFVVAIHLYMLRVAARISNSSQNERSVRLVARLLCLFLLVGLVINYKSLELYSRGFGDTLFMLFFFVSTWAARSRSAERVAPAREASA
jgi:hypothetical protein